MAEERMRIDRWLWAARFFKTRSLAAEAIQSGRVEVDGVRAKPAKEVRPGDLVEVRIGPVRWSVVVRGTSPRRGPASEAVKLYEETDESRERRERDAAMRRLAPSIGTDLKGRPTKRDRRRIEGIRAGLRSRPPQRDGDPDR
jgi:ribosome-associated heat shock protein Hsp15